MTDGHDLPDRHLENNGKGHFKKPPVIKVLVPSRQPPIAKISVPSFPPPAEPIAEPEVILPIETPPPVAPADTVDLPPVKPRRWQFSRSWQFWAVIAVLAATGIGGGSIALLLKIPALPNCPAIFWPTASASLRLYCAEVAANKQTVDNLLEAIALVNSLPIDHPLRPTVNKHIEEWSADILKLAEASFDNGKLDEAIATARRIPANTTAHAAVERKIQQWQATWKQAESIYRQAEKVLKDSQDLRQAFTMAVRLLDIDNKYWKTTKYEELNALINAYRLDGGKLDRAKNLARQGGLQNLLEAIKAANEIPNSSPLHAEAQKLVKDFGRKMLDLAESYLGRRNSDEAIAIVRQIPDIANLQNEVRDFIDLAEAQQQAWNGNPADLEAAILQAQRLGNDRPLYGKAQELIRQWRLEIEDVGHLDRAQELAQPGDSAALAAAISEAALVPRGNPRYDEARRQIAEWTGKVESIEDQPILDQADQLATGGDSASLQAAIDQASRIGDGRVLSSDARRRIREWTAQVQQIQDQPILDRARQLADAGSLQEAIDTAEQIRSGRSLYSEAQTSLRSWRTRLQNQAQLQQAYAAAASDTAAGWTAAIQFAQQISADSPLRSEADRLIDQWSQSLLQYAIAQSQYDLGGAIATADRIPARADVYNAAQAQIQEWRQRLTPAAPSATATPF